MRLQSSAVGYTRVTPQWTCSGKHTSTALLTHAYVRMEACLGLLVPPQPQATPWHHTPLLPVHEENAVL
eukprot:m.238801 g.238801  ORF g.238801 m.238801 type:complete len:69 (+) comp19399_c0_seq3:1602-1808(+)